MFLKPRMNTDKDRFFAARALWFKKMIVIFALVIQMHPSYATDLCATYTPTPGVVPADLNAPIQAVTDPVIIPIEIDLAERFNIDAPNDTNLRPGVAAVAVYQDGRVLYNGQDVSSDVNHACRHKKRTELNE